MIEKKPESEKLVSQMAKENRRLNVLILQKAVNLFNQLCSVGKTISLQMLLEIASLSLYYTNGPIYTSNKIIFSAITVEVDCFY